MRSVELSSIESRRVALAAQRFGRPRPAATPHLGHVRTLVGGLGAVQIDAVNVLVRAHYLPLYARLGSYPRELLDRLVYRHRAAFEYWGHAASVLPVELHPLLRWRMAGHVGHKHWAAFQARVERERPGYLAAVQQEVAERGPLTFGDLTDPARRAKQNSPKYAESTLLWHHWSDGKTALEMLWSQGRLAVAGRRGFERLYDLPERVIPAEVLAVPTPEPAEAQRELVRRAAVALGVATARDLADYFRLPMAATRARLRELVDAGAVLPAQVAGWPEPAYLDPAAGRRRPVHARALVSPFDSLIWERARSERVFGFRPSFELYVKPELRKYGYYVLGFLSGDRFVARVDLKADQRRRTLLVPGAFREPGAPPARTIAGELAAELRELAGWLELETIEVADHGDLAPELRKAA
jgi:hypothetical protein